MDATSQAPYPLGQLADLLDAKLVGDADCLISSIGTITQAQSGQITFLSNSLYQKYLPGTKASAVILTKENLTDCPVNAVVMDNPYLGYAKLSHYFLPPQLETKTGIHPTVVIADSAIVAASANIGPHCVIAGGVEIGENVNMGAHCYIGENSTIGAYSNIYPNVVLYSDCKLGSHAIVHSGTVIGSDGFGFVPVDSEQGSWHKIAQLGGVTIGNNVEIGANTTIDRGALEETIIADNVKLDNQIQIGHNVNIGRGTAIAGCVGIAGSTHIGQYCTIGGGVGIGGHLEIVDHVHITGMTMVTKSVKQAGLYSSGVAINTNAKWRKNAVRFYQLDDMARRLQRLEKEKS